MRHLRAVPLTLLAIAMTAAAAGCGSSGSTGGSGHVTISIDCAPPESQNAVAHTNWLHDVSTFENQNPNITIHSIYGYPCETPAPFTAALKAGTEPNVFYTYFTDLNQVLDNGQAADITKYVSSTTVPEWPDIVATAKKAVTAGSTIYGVPFSNYTQGMIINRKLFQEAGLNPDQPPTTWAQVEADAKKITALGKGIYGYGDYSANNNGGWHFTSEVDANGGQMVNASGSSATFDSTAGLQVLQALHTMRFVDHSMSPTQQLRWGDLQKQMAAGKLGMYIAAPDDVYNVIVPTDGMNVNDLGMGPLPSTSGTPAGSLSGGNTYMFAKRDTPAQIQAGIKFVTWEFLTPGQGIQFDFARNKSTKQQGVGFPEPQLYSGATEQKYERLMDASATINLSYYAPFSSAKELGMGEPTDAQAIYKTLDGTMLAVLSEPNANLSQLLSQASGQVDQLLSLSQ